MSTQRKLTPRQKVALARPVVDTRDLHLRFYKQMVPFQTILTFDLHTPPEDYELEGLEAVEGWVGMWHGRISRLPETPLVQWATGQRSKAKVMLKRLVKGVGREEAQFNDSKDGMALRIFRWGTLDEVARAVRSRDGKNKE